MALDNDTRALNDAVLEQGGPYEILPEELFRWKGMVHHYLRREDRPQEAKDRVRAVWLNGEQRPAWSEERKIPDHVKPGFMKKDTDFG